MDTTDRITTPKKYDENKERFDLIPPKPLFELARTYTHGAAKYGDRNWEDGLEWGRIFAAIMRHLWAFWRGEDKDTESGLSHLAHAAWGCMALMEYGETNINNDNRRSMK